MTNDINLTDQETWYRFYDETTVCDHGYEAFVPEDELEDVVLEANGIFEYKVDFRRGERAFSVVDSDSAFVYEPGEMTEIPASEVPD